MGKITKEDRVLEPYALTLKGYFNVAADGTPTLPTTDSTGFAGVESVAAGQNTGEFNLVFEKAYPQLINYGNCQVTISGAHGFDAEWGANQLSDPDVRSAMIQVVTVSGSGAAALGLPVQDWRCDWELTVKTNKHGQ